MRAATITCLALLPTFGAVGALGACGGAAPEPASDEAHAESARTNPALEPNDVSVLLTLARSPQDRYNYLYLTNSDGSPSPIFPPALVDELPSLFSTPPGSKRDIYKAMQITALRFVPCADAAAGPGASPVPGTGTGTDVACKPAIRLTAQFVTPIAQDAWGFDEVAMHLFYALDTEQTKAVAGDLLELKKASPRPTSGALWVHPGLETDGMAGAWGRRLRTFVTTHARAERLARVTSTAFVFDAWPFRAAKIAGGHMVEQESLPHVAEAATVQRYDIFGDETRIGNIRPASTAEAGATFFLDQKNYLGPSGEVLDTPALRAAIDSVEKTLNPVRHGAESVDCVSCHAARISKENARARGVVFASPESYVPPPWASVERRQDPRIEGAIANVVQFGYLLRKSANGGLPEGSGPIPSVSERVIYESIEAAKLAARLLPP